MATFQNKQGRSSPQGTPLPHRSMVYSRSIRQMCHFDPISPSLPFTATSTALGTLWQKGGQWGACFCYRIHYIYIHVSSYTSSRLSHCLSPQSRWKFTALRNRMLIIVLRGVRTTYLQHSLLPCLYDQLVSVVRPHRNRISNPSIPLVHGAGYAGQKWPFRAYSTTTTVTSDSLAQYITWRAAFLCAMHNEICTPGDTVLLDCAHNLVKYELILHQGYTI